jgi:sterol desaturase/sphingolipid hydroxylase (fatty acid hydroxylase superfamily)
LFWIIPSHPLHGLFILLYLVFGDILGHHGFDRVVLHRKISLTTSHYMHYLHHKYFKVNYGNGVLPFDRWFGTFHDGSDQATEAFKRRARQRVKAREILRLLHRTKNT